MLLCSQSEINGHCLTLTLNETKASIKSFHILNLLSLITRCFSLLNDGYAVEIEGRGKDDFC